MRLYVFEVSVGFRVLLGANKQHVLEEVGEAGVLLRIRIVTAEYAQ